MSFSPVHYGIRHGPNCLISGRFGGVYVLPRVQVRVTPILSFLLVRRLDIDRMADRTL